MKKKSFEEKIRDIESIIGRMENGEIPLEESIKSYEDGMKLIRDCEGVLASMEKKLAVIEKRSNGEWSESVLEEHEKEDGSETVDGFTERHESKVKKKKSSKKVQKESLSSEDEESSGENELSLF